MNAELQEMLDHYQITKLMAEYCHGCDRLNRDLMASTYLEDSWDDHGDNKCPGHEFTDRCMNNLGKNTNSCSHHLGQTMVKVAGDKAGAETYFIAILRVPRKRGDEVLNQIGGRYVDELARVDGKWKIKKRLCVRDWSITIPITEDFLKNEDFIQGGRWGKDVSFNVLGL